jgi:hypothetical protein
MKNPNKCSKLKSQEEGEMLEEEEMLAVDEAVDEAVQLQVQNARKWRKLLKN